MQTRLVLSLALLALAACGTPMQTTDASPDAPAPDAATADGAATELNATEMALLGTWTRERAESMTEGFTWRLVLRADRTSELTYAVVITSMSNCVTQSVVTTRAWSATADGAVLTFGEPTRGPTMSGPCSRGAVNIGTTLQAETAGGDLALAVAGATMTTRPAGQPASSNVTWTRQ